MDALLHRYGGSVSFLDDWMWDEAVSYIGRVMELIKREEKRLRWYIRYEDQFQKFDDFDRATKPRSERVKSIGDIYADTEKLMDLTWEEVHDGERD